MLRILEFIALDFVGLVILFFVAAHYAEEAESAPRPAVLCAAYDTRENRAWWNEGARVRSARPLGAHEDEWHYARGVPRIVSRVTFDWPVRPHSGTRFACEIRKGR